MRLNMFPSFKTKTPIRMDVHRSIHRVKTSHMQSPAFPVDFLQSLGKTDDLNVGESYELYNSINQLDRQQLLILHPINIKLSYRIFRVSSFYNFLADEAAFEEVDSTELLSSFYMENGILKKCRKLLK